MKGGIQLPMTHVKNDTTFKGNTQYPSKLALWKNDLSLSHQRVHIGAEKVGIDPDNHRPDPHDDKYGRDYGLLGLSSSERKSSGQQ